MEGLGLESRCELPLCVCPGVARLRSQARQQRSRHDVGRDRFNALPRPMLVVVGCRDPQEGVCVGGDRRVAGRGRAVDGDPRVAARRALPLVRGRPCDAVRVGQRRRHQLGLSGPGRGQGQRPRFVLVGDRHLHVQRVGADAVADLDGHLVGAVGAGVGRGFVVRLRCKEIGGHDGEVEAQHARGLVDAEAAGVRARQAPSQQLPVRLGRGRVGSHTGGAILLVADGRRAGERLEFDDVGDVDGHRRGGRFGQLRTVGRADAAAGTRLIGEEAEGDRAIAIRREADQVGVRRLAGDHVSTHARDRSAADAERG